MPDDSDWAFPFDLSLNKKLNRVLIYYRADFNCG